MTNTTRRKLQEAQFFLRHLLREAKRTAGDHEPFLFYLSAFLSAGRSVTLVLQKEAKADYDRTFPTWMQNLSPEDRGLLDYFVGQRNAEVHESGADYQLGKEYIPVYDVYEDEYGRFEISSPPPTLGFPASAPAHIGRPSRYFTIEGQQREVTTACERYVDLLEAFLQEFDRQTGSSTYSTLWRRLAYGVGADGGRAVGSPG